MKYYIHQSFIKTSNSIHAFAYLPPPPLPPSNTSETLSVNP